MTSFAGTLRRPHVFELRTSAEPGNQGIVAMTRRSQRRPSAANCWRLNGADSGSTALGKIRVMARTRRRRTMAASLVPARRQTQHE